ncbi:autotransporter-associated beta strand repeat-containing protein, partial [Escherichia coli]|uniref:autotransporter-associated beta strand repeat-containing protein n=1 Tax=Escherichia coli TaxID=562 RepID=UPI003F80D0F1
SSSVDHVFSGVVSGAGRIEKDTASSVWTLSGNNSFTGSVTVSAGSLAVTHDNGLGTSAGGVTVGTASVLDLQAVTVGAES